MYNRSGGTGRAPGNRRRRATRFTVQVPRPNANAVWTWVIPAMLRHQWTLHAMVKVQRKRTCFGAGTTLSQIEELLEVARFRVAVDVRACHLIQAFVGTPAFDRELEATF